MSPIFVLGITEPELFCLLGLALAVKDFDVDTEFKSEILNRFCCDRMLRRGSSPSSHNPNQKMLAERASLPCGLPASSANQSLYSSLHDHFLIMARRRQAPHVADVISSSPSGCDRGPTGTSPARGEIMELNLRKGFLPTRAIF